MGEKRLDSVRVHAAADDPRHHHRGRRQKPVDAFLPPGGDSGGALEASDDGQNYHMVVAIPKGGSTEHTLSFAPVTAKFFRVTFKTQPAPPNPFADMGEPLACCPSRRPTYRSPNWCCIRARA